ncbi:MAG: tat pathway signal sequence [Mycobacteriaceae bacterium]
MSCPLPTTGFTCAEQDDISSAERSLANRPGTTGIVLRDRQTGAVWANSYASTMVWTASTIKLAMVVDLFTRAGRGQITLTPVDRNEIQAMLHSSDDDAADALWYRYAGTDHLRWNHDFPAYGLSDLTPQRGFSRYYPYWGFQKTTSEDLDRLIHYVLTDLDAPDRRYIVDQLQHVAPDQQWGVWGSGPRLAPGNKDGWSREQGGWVINSVGFVGPGQRWTLAMMSSLDGQGGYDDGVATLNSVAATITAGLS